MHLEIESFLQREDLRYQSFTIPGRQATPGHDRSYVNDVVFAEDIAGKSLLDIGSYLGYFCVEALKRGAAAATGIDPNRESLRKARELAGFFGMDPTYLHADFETWDPGGQKFDVVLALNVLHHMFDAVHALRRMMALSRDRVVLEVAQFTYRDIQHGWFNPLALLLPGTAQIIMAPAKRAGHIANRTFLFTPAAMRMLFNQHTARFEPIAVTRSPFKGRFIVSARRRRIKELIAVVGPTSAGKSTFARRLVTDRELRGRIGLDGPPTRVIKARQFETLPAEPIERLLVEYDLTDVMRADLQSFDREPAYQLLECAERVRILTVFAEPGHLDQQLSRRERKRLAKKAGGATLEALSALYRGEGSDMARGIYRAWFEAAHNLTSSGLHQLVVNGWETYGLAPAGHWEEWYDRLYPARAETSK